MDPGLVGPELFAGFAGRIFVATFLLLSPSAMSGPDPRARKSRYRYKTIDTTGSYQNGQHLLGPIPGDEDDESYDSEEEAMRMDGSAEKLGSGNEDEMKDEARVEVSNPFEYETQEEGLAIGSITRPTSLCFTGLSAGGEGAIIKKVLIDDEEKLVEEKRRLVFEVMHYEVRLKRARLKAMKSELGKLSLEEMYLSGFSDWRYRQADEVREADCRKKVLECEESKPVFELMTESIEQYAVKEMAELGRINFHHICFIPDSYLSGFSDERCKSGQDNRAHHCKIEEAAKPGGEEEMLN